MSADKPTKIPLWDNVIATTDYCLHLPKHNTIIIADLHLGLEGVLRLDGVSIPQYQEKIITNRLNTIIDKYQPENIIVNGDFKHEFGKNLRQEWREVGKLLQHLSEEHTVILIRGNHDNYLKTIASKHNVPMKMSHTIDDILITHGHKKITHPKTIIAHEHPFIRLRDAVGAMLSLPCFLVSDDLIVMPAFSPLASGTDMTEAEKQDFLSPQLQRYNVDKLRVVAISEIGLLDFCDLKHIKKMKI